MLTNLKKAGGTCHVQISGGEPTVREDLPAIVSLARRQGFSLVQVNTNGLRLGGEVGYAERLRQAGADSVYLQYDGVSAAAFAALRGRSDIIEGKNKAIQFCGAAGLGVVLVSTLVCGVNDGEMGALLRFALTQGPTVRGVHFQPAASFGRFPWHIESAPRLTLPEIMVKLVEQTPDLIQMEDFHPPGCEHALCSFSAVYTRNGAGNSLTPSGRNEQDKICCPPPPPGLSDAPPHAAHGARKAIHFTTRHWKAPKLDTPDLKDDFAAFVSKAGLERRFTVSAMAFQDALSLDLARIRGCCIHVARPDGRLVPFCLHNLTSRDGVRLYA
jgi:uncharacterized radical SAM superfamily Fe-S cluster-containing enzyme